MANLKIFKKENKKNEVQENNIEEKEYDWNSEIEIYQDLISEKHSIRLNKIGVVLISGLILYGLRLEHLAIFAVSSIILGTYFTTLAEWMNTGSKKQTAFAFQKLINWVKFRNFGEKLLNKKMETIKYKWIDFIRKEENQNLIIKEMEYLLEHEINIKSKAEMFKLKTQYISAMYYEDYSEMFDILNSFLINVNTQKRESSVNSVVSINKSKLSEENRDLKKENINIDNIEKNKKEEKTNYLDLI